jgi:hypothetical protein
VPDDQRQTYYIVAKEFPVAIALHEVTYLEALTIAANCMIEGQILCGPDDGTDGYVVGFDRVAGVRVTARQPTGPAMAMPADLVQQLAVEHEDTGFTPDDSKDGDHG